MNGMMDFGWGNMLGAGMLGLGIAASILLLLNVLAMLWALADVMRRKKLDAGVRIGWVIIILVLQIVGVLLYVFAGKERE